MVNWPFYHYYFLLVATAFYSLKSRERESAFWTCKLWWRIAGFPLLFAGSDLRQVLDQVSFAASLRSCVSTLTFFFTQTPQHRTARKQVGSWALDTASQAIEGKAETKPCTISPLWGQVAALAWVLVALGWRVIFTLWRGHTLPDRAWALRELTFYINLGFLWFIKLEYCKIFCKW